MVGISWGFSESSLNKQALIVLGFWLREAAKNLVDSPQRPLAPSPPPLILNDLLLKGTAIVSDVSLTKQCLKVSDVSITKGLQKFQLFYLLSGLQ